MCINFLMNYYLCTNFGKILKIYIYTNFEKNFEKKILKKYILLKFWKKNFGKIYTLKF